jgi:NADH dehydrogenase [ubiquinone] 1 alpha subcomplex assembly factor 5
MASSGHPPEIFDRERRRALRKRAERRGGDVFLWQQIADDIADRLTDVSRTFTDVLFIGPMAAFAEQILAGRKADVTLAPLIDEDRLPYTAGSFDLAICAGTLDSVNDLPGALVQIRKSLRPDGLFLGHMFGVGTLASLKNAMLAAEQDQASPHIHPQIDLRSAADLLARTGFALPVADIDRSTIRYREWQTLVSDIRNMGVGNALAGPRQYLGRTTVAAFDKIWCANAAHDGTVEEHFVHINLSGWAPSADQPKPAKRGSGKVSLASILRPPMSSD